MYYFRFYFATNILIFVTTWLKMVAYTNESQQNINKKDMIPVILSLLNKLDEGKNNAGGDP